MFLIDIENIQLPLSLKSDNKFVAYILLDLFTRLKLRILRDCDVGIENNLKKKIVNGY